MLKRELVRTPTLIQGVVSNRHKSENVVLFIHGNGSSSVFWEEQLRRLPTDIYGLAIDLRGYGITEPLPLDATKGGYDWARDILELLDHQKIKSCHLVAHSMGAAVVYNLLDLAPKRFETITLIAPVSPFGFGGTKDEKGTPCHIDYAGTGAGTVNPEFVKRLQKGDTSSSNPESSPREIMNAFYWKPPFIPKDEAQFLASLFSMKIGENGYPGDFEKSPNWPHFTPGKRGPVNANSPKYAIPVSKRLLKSNPKKTFLWVRGSHDQIVSDNSVLGVAHLGKIGVLENYPGQDIYPPQPMDKQTRYFLNKLKKGGSIFKEVVFEDTGHSPHIEKPEKFAELLLKQLKSELSYD